MTQQFSAWFIGEGALLTQAAETWIAAGNAVAGIASEEPHVTQWTHQRGLRLIGPKELEVQAARSEFDYLFSIVNLTMLAESVIRLPKRAAVNFHDGPLPRYAGVNATVWALLNGESQHGVTWHKMEVSADEGDLLVQRLIDIDEDETAFSLNAKCFTAGIETFRELTDALQQSSLTATPQDLRARSYFGFYDRPERAMLLDFAKPAESLARLVRALDFGRYPNPVGLPKLLTSAGPLLVGGIEVLDHQSGAAPGSVLSTSELGVVVSTATEDVRLEELKTPSGERVDAAALARASLTEGASLPVLSPQAAERLSASNGEAARSEGYFLRRLSDPKPLELPFTPSDTASPELIEARLSAPAGVAPQRLPALLLAFCARLSHDARFDVSYADPKVREHGRACPGFFADEIPLCLSVSERDDLESVIAAIEGTRNQVARRVPYATDLFARQPSLSRAPLPVTVLVDVEAASDLPTGSLTVFVDTQRGTLRLLSRSDRATRKEVDELTKRLGMFLERCLSASGTLADVPLLSDEERSLILERWNDTSRDVPQGVCLHELFAARSQQHPEQTAVTAQGRSYSYGELDRRANALAKRLVELGVGPDYRVGIFMGRTVDLPLAVLAIHKAGGAYVPLDPKYPADRLSFMVEDAGLDLVVSDRQHVGLLPSGGRETLCVEDVMGEEGAPPEKRVTDANLAYVIYTSGSTGKPKGVMVEHRNVINFFVGMDEVIGTDPGTWLAVTSLSFDISVLELLWTLTRGFHVVIHAGDVQQAQTHRKLDFSAFYFSSDDSGGGPEHYQLLLDGARFADQNGFVAVWTPERHFHAFGGLYPNPSVVSAALAMITEHVSLRAGSCVSPLHSPIRIAEEWSVVDNLSNGRVGISFASGWQPNDFAIRPDTFAQRKSQMFEDIETVRRLWRGERVQFKGGTGKDVGVSTLPRPVQPELPIWVTAAGNPETFEAAGRTGANLLTHLLGQTMEEVAEKIRIYRAAREAAGHTGRGVVSLMLHTFVGPDETAVRDTVREPMKAYLRSAVGLVKQAAWSFPTFKQKFDDDTFAPEKLTDEEMDALLEYAFARYYSTSGLFGTVEQATEIARKVRDIDVDDIACLIDFGVEGSRVIEHLPYVAEVLKRVNADAVSSGEAAPTPVGALFAEHAVTHFQCTPSMASMLLLDSQARTGLAKVSTLLIGGEAFPTELAKELRQLVNGRIVNVYGPTETTVWSSTYALNGERDEIPIGRPIANTEILILDHAGSLAPPGQLGELCIGGRGVVRGYLGREELTQERFIPHPLRTGSRLYRTGDLAFFDGDGVLHFRGRLDDQVKVRGYRIELGEIETRLSEHPDVQRCVVVAREDSAQDKRLVGYVIAGAAKPSSASLRAHLQERLPEYMVPTNFVLLDSFPETPNKKIDRKALPAPERKAPASTRTDTAMPANALEETIAVIWRDVLNTPEVSVDDNFFDLGGHSLLTIQVLGKLKPKVSRPLSLIDLFAHPTIRGLAEFLATEQVDERLDASAARGARRRAMRTRRR